MRRLPGFDDMEVVGAAVGVDGDVGGDARCCRLDGEGTATRDTVELKTDRVTGDDRADGFTLTEFDCGDAVRVVTTR